MEQADQQAPEQEPQHGPAVMRVQARLQIYYITAVLGFIFGALSFAYNAWRMEVTEDNSNIRTAAFEVLTVLAEFEQLVYAGHYDQDTVGGNPRTGWVKVELVVDLSSLIGTDVDRQADGLMTAWQENWATFAEDQQATDTLVEAIEAVREAIKAELRALK